MKQKAIKNRDQAIFSSDSVFSPNRGVCFCVITYTVSCFDKRFFFKRVKANPKMPKGFMGNLGDYSIIFPELSANH